MTIVITNKQAEILDYIEKYVKEHGYSPTYRDIADACLKGGEQRDGTVYADGAGTVAWHLGKLELAGRITRERGIPRTVRVVKKYT